jgi:AraC family transcriptional regulator
MSRVAQDVLGRPISEVCLHDVLNAEDPVITTISDAIVGETKSSSIGGQIYAEALGIQLSVHLLRNYANIKYRESTNQARLSKRQHGKLIEFMKENLQHQVSIENLAEVTGVGVWTFCRRFKETYGTTPSAYLMEKRIERAKEMLRKSELPIKAVAAECGFSDQSHMTRVFRRKLGLTPGQIRQSRD